MELIKQKNGVAKPNFSIVTPLYTEKPIWIAPPNGLEHHDKKHTLSFIRALQLIAHHYDGYHNDENITTIKTITKKIDNIRLQKNRKQNLCSIILNILKIREAILI